MAIFNSYVELPEGRWIMICKIVGLLLFLAFRCDWFADRLTTNLKNEWSQLTQSLKLQQGISIFSLLVGSFCHFAGHFAGWYYYNPPNCVVWWCPKRGTPSCLKLSHWSCLLSGSQTWQGNIRNHLVGGLEHFLSFHILGMSSSQLTFIFFRGIETTNQSCTVDLPWNPRFIHGKLIPHETNRAFSLGTTDHRIIDQLPGQIRPPRERFHPDQQYLGECRSVSSVGGLVRNHVGKAIAILCCFNINPPSHFFLQLLWVA